MADEWMNFNGAVLKKSLGQKNGFEKEVQKSPEVDIKKGMLSQWVRSYA